MSPMYIKVTGIVPEIIQVGERAVSGERKHLVDDVSRWKEAFFPP